MPPTDFSEVLKQPSRIHNISLLPGAPLPAVRFERYYCDVRGTLSQLANLGVFVVTDGSR